MFRESGMNRISVLLALLIALCGCEGFAAVQNVSGAVAVPLDANGVADGAAFTAQGVTPSTLTVGNGENINNNSNSNGVTTDSPGVGTIQFLGTTGTSIVNGAVGPINSMGSIQGGLGSSTIIFNGVVSAATFTVTGNGTMRFNNTANGALTFNTDGNLIVGAGATFNGAVNNLAANTGTLTLGSASTLIGAVGSAVGALKQVNVLDGNATITGALSATNFSLLTNTLTLNGALALPVNSVINTTVVSDTLFGNIFGGAGDDQISAASVTVNVDATGAILTGAPLFVVTAGSGTSAVPIIVTDNSVRYSFIGNNLNGNITITPTLIPSSELVTNPNAAAVGSVWDALIPIAAANPGTDLAFVQTQLNALPTAAAYEDALLQIGPASGLIGVNRESFNTTKQFQKVWLRHLHRHPCDCLFQNANRCNSCEDSCNSCRRGYECGTVWLDGFGYHGKQDDKDGLNGYKVTTWGGMLAAETASMCSWRVGLAAGYAHSTLDEDSYGSDTDITNWQGTIYFNYDADPCFVDGGFSYGWNQYDGKRVISFPGIDRVASAEYDGQEYTGFLVAGYHYYCGCSEITPFASILYSRLNVDGYTETGADSLNLDVSSQSYDFWESGLGLRWAYLFQYCGCSYIPEVHAVWLHDFEDNGLDVNASYTGLGAGGGVFNNRGPGIDRDTWDIGAGITWITTCNFSIQLIYDYEKSSSYQSHQGLLELGYSF